MKMHRAILTLALTTTPCKSFAIFNRRVPLLRSLYNGKPADSRSDSHAKDSIRHQFMSTQTADTINEASTLLLKEHSESYNSLVEKLEVITQLSRAKAVLSYDQMVFMPKSDETSAERGAQMAALAAVIHEKSTDEELLNLIRHAERDIHELRKRHDSPDAFADETRLLELEKKDFVENARVSTDLARKAAELSASANAAWAKARAGNDFESFSPVLQDCFDTAVEIARAKRGENEDISDYTQMLSQFEVGMAPSRIDQIFDEVQSALVPLITEVLDSPASTPPSSDALEGTFPIEKQKELCGTIVRAMGFETDMGRFDESVHPFTSSFSPRDVRITSRFRDSEWYQALAATMHEGGHALYEQNLRPSALGIDTALSMGAHESQSLFWERHVGLTRAFWDYCTPIVKDTFDGFDYTAEQVYAAVNSVSRSLIRVEADELTYPLHVILRYKVERDIVEGRMEVKDLPARWNKEMKEMLQIDVPTDADGCLQDIHWPMMAIGYFPTYLIGSITAAQMSHYCRKDIPDFDEKLTKGDFSEIKDWLTHKVHRHGKRFTSLDDMLEDQLGEKLNPKYFIEYLSTKYSALYGV